ncbi:hypothetical protein SPI_06697 [Niveomyces insectorum RCEF 264]|uniref:Uncharacterized protein n=1 Tax=Niveomyces insectorum RCEF 264 TaxID=1081102 RepID=A0A167RI77_9HYPO|nr:hypothetical protein SPI_06697 [Niveomyces insectorum RCEF 264]
MPLFGAKTTTMCKDAKTRDRANQKLLDDVVMLDDNGQITGHALIPIENDFTDIEGEGEIVDRSSDDATDCSSISAHGGESDTDMLIVKKKAGNEKQRKSKNKRIKKVAETKTATKTATKAATETATKTSKATSAAEDDSPSKQNEGNGKSHDGNQHNKPKQDGSRGLSAGIDVLAAGAAKGMAGLRRVRKVLRWGEASEDSGDEKMNAVEFQPTINSLRLDDEDPMAMGTLFERDATGTVRIAVVDNSQTAAGEKQDENETAERK